jgi:hypothetical protein
MSGKPERVEPRERDETRDPKEHSESESTFWQWFALAALLFAWIAEATMCAERGF